MAIMNPNRKNTRCGTCGNFTVAYDAVTDARRCGYTLCPSNVEELVPPVMEPQANIVIEPKVGCTCGGIAGSDKWCQFCIDRAVARKAKAWPPLPYSESVVEAIMPELRGGAVRQEAMADARKLRWRAPLDNMPTDRPVIISRQVRAGGAEWLVARLEPNGQPPFIHGREATHWCEDTLGTP